VKILVKLSRFQSWTSSVVKGSTLQKDEMRRTTSAVR
jgi:hypothetical protein